MDSDDDGYLSEILEKAERNKSYIEPLLFARPDGLPMTFEILDFNFKIKQFIEENGGIVVDSENDAFKENTIKLCSRDSTGIISDDIFDEQFIYDSIATNAIGNLDDYRLGKSVTLDEDEVDPTDILLGYKGWNNKKPCVEVEKEVGESQPSKFETNEPDLTFHYCDVEQTEIGSLKTEDELWEARPPSQVYISQDPEEGFLGKSDMTMANQIWDK